MQKHLSALAITMWVTLASAQVVEIQKNVICSTPDHIFQELAKEYNERIYWTGSADQSNSVYMLWVNDKNNSWTLTQSNKDISCIIGAGHDNRLFLGTQL